MMASPRAGMSAHVRGLAVALAALFASSAADAGLAGAYRFPDGRAVLESSDVPTVWLLGAEDRSAPNAGTRAFLDRLARQGRRQATIVFPGADHGIVLYRRSADVRTATAYHPEYFSTKVQVIRALAAGRWPPVPVARPDRTGGPSRGSLHP